MANEKLSAPGVVAHDYDGDAHLVALVDDIDEWRVTVTLRDGTTEVVDPTPARSFHYQPDLHGRPSWFIDHDLGQAKWQLAIGGRPVTRLHDPRKITSDEPGNWAVQRLRALGHEWRDHPDRPRVDSDVLAHWDQLIGWWINNRDLPLPIRTGSNRGLRKRYRGIEAVHTDNSPAQWLFARLIDHEGPWTPDPDELADAILAEMPVAMVLDRETRERQHLNRRLSDGPSTQQLGYRLCHITPVAEGRHRIGNLSADKLRDRARRLVHPANMFVVPSTIGPIGELAPFIEAMASEHVTCEGSVGPSWSTPPT